MPKKFTGLNSKAAAAKARKDEKSEAERLRKQQEEEDALWKDDGDKNMQKKKVISVQTCCGRDRHATSYL